MENEILRKLVFIGDSITDCGRLFDRDGLGRGYVYQIAKQLGAGVSVYNRGHNGFTAFQVEEHLEKDCLRFRPTEVSLLVGINDVSAYLGGAGGYPAAEYQKLLSRILSRCRRNGAERLTVIEPFLFSRPAEYVSWMDTLKEFQVSACLAAAAAEARFLPAAALFREAEKTYSTEKLTTDGIHLTKLGHQILAEAWLSVNCD